MDYQTVMGWLKKRSAARAFGGLFGKRTRALEIVMPGTIFRHIHQDNLEETAEVVSVVPDTYGIPHVHFLLSFRRRPNRMFFDGGARMLALESFADRFEEQVTT